MYQVMAGYYKDPIATSKAIDRDGWFNTGDLGFINPVRWRRWTALQLPWCWCGVRWFCHVADALYGRFCFPCSCMQVSGDLVLTGRAKDVIVLSNGENIEPQPIEDAILEKCSFADQVPSHGHAISTVS